MKKKPKAPPVDLPVLVPERLPSVSSPGMQALDATAGAAVMAAQDILQVWARMGPMVGSYMESLQSIVEKQVEFAKTYNPASHDDYVREVHATAGALFGQLERIARTATGMAKVADQLARLDRHMAGNEQKDDLGSKSIAELARIVKGAARALGDDN